MRTFAKSRIRYSKSQRMGIFAFLIVLIGFQFLNFFLSQSEPVYEVAEVPEDVLHLDLQLASAKTSTNSSEYSLENFDPNKLSAEEWQKLGFSEKQVNTILKYKYSIGGYFSDKEEIKNCFVISEKKFSEIEPFIVFEDLNRYENSRNSYFNSKSPKEAKTKIRYEKFNPNDYTLEDWKRIGFSEKQATTILKYKKSRGGKFNSLQEIAACFVISDEKFAEMKPYMVLPTVKSKGEIKLLEEEAEVSEPKPLKIESFNPNELRFDEWLQLGFTEKQANTILNYKKSLGGKFKDAETFGKCYAVSTEKLAELEPYMVFD
ncbi:hypothetical protein [Moheibacter sp.]|uniref:hypothetical protein n=1 Tax=Moheibacter sp. TaxID=1965316 RepID=UPI003C770050